MSSKESNDQQWDTGISEKASRDIDGDKNGMGAPKDDAVVQIPNYWDPVVVWWILNFSLKNYCSLPYDLKT